jgi:hypothetical protein
MARIGGNHPAESTTKFVAAMFEHDTARPVDGYAAPNSTCTPLFSTSASARTVSIAPCSRRTSLPRNSSQWPFINLN